MTESYSDLQQLFKNQVNTRVFSCNDSVNGKSHEIDRKDVLRFYKHYCDTCFGKDFNSWNQLPILTISEKVEKHVPVIGDFVLKFDHQSDQLYTDNLINEIIKTYQHIIIKHFDITSDVYETICVFLKSKVWYEQGKSCIKLRFQFPFCRTKRDIVNSFVNPNIIDLLEKNAVTSNYSEQIEGGWNGALRDIGEHVTMYGSTDNPKQIPPLLFVSVHSTEGSNGVCDTLSLKDIYNHDKHSFLIKEKCDVDEIDIINDECDIEDDYTFSLYTLPMFLSIYYCPSNCSLKEDEEDDSSETSSVIIEEDEEDEEEQEIKNDLDLCNDLVKYLSPKRFNSKTCFLDMGRAFYNATDGASRGLYSWIAASKKSKKFDKEFCEINYDTFENDKVTVRTLGWYFRADNRKKYDNWHRNWCYPTLYDSRECDHTVVGEAFYKCFWTRYIFTGKKWYEFRRNRLVCIEEQKIEKTISAEFIPNFDNLSYQLQGEIQKLNSRMKIGSKTYKDKVEKLQEEIQKVQKLIQRLRNVPFRGCLLKSIRTFFYYENINKVLNKNPNLLGCSNCVIELTDDKAVKREGKPEDFITKKIGVPYMSNYSFDHPDVKDIIKYITQVFPNKEIRDYMYKDLASMLYRRNAEKLFRVWIGDTNGSKSILMKMIRQWLGDYYCDLPEEFFCAKKMSSSGPSPELAQTEDAAVAFTSEPDSDESWKGARIKKITGGDSFYARSCGEDGGTIESTFKYILVLNIVPDINGMDEATKNRFMMIPFEGRWLKPEEAEKTPVADTFEEQVERKTYIMDPRFEDNIPRLASALNWLCIQNYSKYLKEGLNKPTYIRQYMDDYWERNDPFTSFIEEVLDIPKRENGLVDDTKYITATDLYPKFKSWFKSNYANLKLVEKSKFVSFMSSPDRLGKQTRKRWCGFTLRTMPKND